MSNPSMYPFSSSELMPQEETLAVGRKKGRMQIGMPKETSMQERRVVLTPDGVNLLVNNGHEVCVETGVGEGARYTDRDYSEAGAKIVYGPKEAFQCDIVLKIEPPSEDELQMLTNKQTLISALQIKMREKSFFEKLMKKKTTAIAVEYICDADGQMPIRQCMSEIVGNTSILIAAELLSNANEGKGYVLGGVSGVPPTEIVILGAGMVGLYAAKVALAMGANVKVFDKSIYRLKRLAADLPHPIYTCVLQPKILEKALRRCDVLIGAMKPEHGRTPVVVTSDMVQLMKPKSVIVDVSIDNGGCIETSEITSHEKPVFFKHDIIHYGVPNIASRVARTASFSMNNIFAPLLLNIGEEGGMENAIRYLTELRTGMYMYNGLVTNRFLGELFDLPYSEGSILFGEF